MKRTRIVRILPWLIVIGTLAYLLHDRWPRVVRHWEQGTAEG